MWSWVYDIISLVRPHNVHGLIIITQNGAFVALEYMTIRKLREGGHGRCST